MSEEAKTLLYLVVRADLKPGLQAAQIAHVAVEIGLRQPEAIRAWHRGSQTVVCLAAKSLFELTSLAFETVCAGLPVVTFQEPDLGGEMTALAVLGSGLFPTLPLALRPICQGCWKPERKCECDSYVRNGGLRSKPWPKTPGTESTGTPQKSSSST